MLEPLFYSRGWTCFGNKDSKIASNLQSIDQIKELISQLPDTLKDNHRSLVKKGDMFGTTVVAKQPRDKNRRRWSRILSLLWEGEAKQMLIALQQCQQYGIESLQPLLALEHRQAGMITDSWVVYGYREGQPANKQALPKIVETLDKLHRLGHRHNDPNFGNFLIDDTGKLFLIDCILRSRTGSYTDYLDFLLLGTLNDDISLSDVEQLIQPNRCSLGYWLARTVIGYRSGRGKLKRFLRPNKPKNNPTNN